ncbi:hypothetical protein INT45_004511 [Circinella minor]|uniref:Uncharacterized protein n=1 Tax=Circinella minor TaxID=1195481 RepID=A0A8H7VDN6_9FUNG|nr:hypothetical protein INT45_004511 [Circinella minor]
MPNTRSRGNRTVQNDENREATDLSGVSAQIASSNTINVTGTRSSTRKPSITNSDNNNNNNSNNNRFNNNSSINNKGRKRRSANDNNSNQDKAITNKALYTIMSQLKDTIDRVEKSQEASDTVLAEMGTKLFELDNSLKSTRHNKKMRNRSNNCSDRSSNSKSNSDSDGDGDNDSNSSKDDSSSSSSCNSKSKNLIERPTEIRNNRRCKIPLRRKGFWREWIKEKYMDNDERRTDNAMENIRNELRRAITKINEQDHISRHTDWSLINKKIQKKRAIDFERLYQNLQPFSSQVTNPPSDSEEIDNLNSTSDQNSIDNIQSSSDKKGGKQKKAHRNRY